MQGYEIQRSVGEPGRFSTIAYIKAEARSSSNRYSFKDKDVSPGVSYFYRLKMINTNGKASYSATRKEQLLSSNELAVEIFPNPSKEQFYLKVSSYSGSLAYKIFDNTGRLVQSHNAAANEGSTFSINLKGLSAGTYWVQVNAGGKLLVKKITTL